MRTEPTPPIEPDTEPTPITDEVTVEALAAEFAQEFPATWATAGDVTWDTIGDGSWNAK